MSKIEWTEQTWNFITGCTKVSAGCKNCYAEKMHKRLHAMGSEKYLQPFSQVAFHEQALGTIVTRVKPTMYFVNSMSDTFHEDIAFADIDYAFRVMDRCKQHTFQVLTKRPSSAQMFVESANLRLNKDYHYPDNVWFGVTVENREALHRIDKLRDAPAKTKFISFEPLLEDLGIIDLQGVDWVIIGAESGKDRRPCNVAWIKNIVRQAIVQNVAIFVKQIHENTLDYDKNQDKKVVITKLVKDINQFPKHLQIQEYPKNK